MKILITGARGQVGCELVKRGIKEGQDIIATDVSELDITRQDAVLAFVTNHRPDLIINAAAYTAVDKAEDERDLAYAINRDGPANLATACARFGIPLLHISTDYVFDGKKKAFYRESDPPNPQSAYGRSKWEGDRVVEETLEKQLTLRVAWVFGATGKNFVRSMLNLGKERDELGIVADQSGGPTWAGDIASVLLGIAEQYHRGEAVAWGTYHYTGRPATTWHGFAETIYLKAVSLGMMDRVPNIRAISSDEYPAHAPRPENSILDCSKIQQKLGIWQPDWRNGLNQVLFEWKNNGI